MIERIGSRLGVNKSFGTYSKTEDTCTVPP